MKRLEVKRDNSIGNYYRYINIFKDEYQLKSRTFPSGVVAKTSVWNHKFPLQYYYYWCFPCIHEFLILNNCHSFIFLTYAVCLRTNYFRCIISLPKLSWFVSLLEIKWNLEAVNLNILSSLQLSKYTMLPWMQLWAI